MNRKEAKEVLSIILRNTENDCVYSYDHADGSEELVQGSDIAEALTLAIATLRKQDEHENKKPLTMDELRQMDGEPVWLHTFSSVQRKTNIAQWAILESVGNSNAVFLKGGCNSRITKCFSNYGMTWLAYRSKP